MELRKWRKNVAKGVDRIAQVERMCCETAGKQSRTWRKSIAKGVDRKCASEGSVVRKYGEEVVKKRCESGGSVVRKMRRTESASGEIVIWNWWRSGTATKRMMSLGPFRT